ncbi:hypothetical protein E2562_011840 [Oryza meyeriana var. granulata]|uniref:RING-type E3 ubiquitin transferase n=1 Tax=Oryza meyeriana var. granulata TaxID=110450 RepID=A0A6G1CQB6_9ORYZ|nr:hypothetical protein E2562_011840 [Oryza meyeriana var. granulata]
MGRYHDRKDLDTSSYPLVAVCIDKDKNSPNALKWAIDTLVRKGHIIVLVHVNTKGTLGGVEDASGFKQPTDPHLRDLFLPFRCFCTRKDIQCKDVLLDDHDVAKSITEFSALAAIEKLVVGATARGGFRFKADIPTTISKGAPDFCTVYVINNGKVSSVRNSIRQAPRVSPLRCPGSITTSGRRSRAGRRAACRASAEDVTSGIWLNMGNKAKNRVNIFPRMYDFKGVKPEDFLEDTIGVHQLKQDLRWAQTLEHFNVTWLDPSSKTTNSIS